MNDLQVEYFLAVAENLSFTKTAAEKYVSQPAVSKQISAMEEELGVILFERSYKNVKLTEAGRLFADFYKKHRQDLNLVHQQAKNVRRDSSVLLKVGIGSGWSMTGLIPAVTARLREKNPDFRVALEAYSFRQLSAAVGDDRADVAITLTTDVPSLPSLEQRHLMSVPRYIIYSKYHPLASRENLQIGDFKDEPFFAPMPEETVFITDLIKNFCEPFGFVPKLQKVGSNESLMMGVANGLGVAIVDGWTVDFLGDHCIAIPLHSNHDISVIWRKTGKNPALQPFLNELMAVAENK